MGQRRRKANFEFSIQQKSYQCVISGLIRWHICSLTNCGLLFISKKYQLFLKIWTYENSFQTKNDFSFNFILCTIANDCFSVALLFEFTLKCILFYFDMLITFCFGVSSNLSQEKSLTVEILDIYFFGTIVWRKYLPKIFAVGLFCCDKFEETPKQKVINMSK